MKQETLEQLAQLRVLVGYLGEQTQNDWWSSNFLGASSSAYLAPIYPRTVLLAQYRGVCEAALLVHDEFIGVGTNFHLYRLPEAVEHDVADYIRSADEQTFRSLVSSRDSALDSLKAMAASNVEQKQGPVMVGGYSESSLPRVLQECAAYYATAFGQGVQCYPFMREAS